MRHGLSFTSVRDIRMMGESLVLTHLVVDYTMLLVGTANGVHAMPWSKIAVAGEVLCEMRHPTARATLAVFQLSPKA